MNKRQRRKRMSRILDRMDDPETVKKLAEASAEFIRAQLRRPSMWSDRGARPVGKWRDDAGVVHGVNALTIVDRTDMDLGRETACETTFWTPEEPAAYPDGIAITGEIDCMGCLARGGSTCLE